MKEISEKRRVDFMISRKLHAEAQYRANMQGKTLTEYLVEAIEEKIKKEDNK